MKVNNFLANFWFKMSPIERLIFAIVAAILLYMVYKYAKSRLQSASRAAEKKGEIDALKATGQKASYTDSQYEAMAKTLFDAMNGMGTDDAAIYAVFKKLKNDLDFVKLESAFGIREADDNLFGYLEPQDLSGWIKDDLSDTEVARLNNQLKVQNLTKRF